MAYSLQQIVDGFVVAKKAEDHCYSNSSLQLLSKRKLFLMSFLDAHVNKDDFRILRFGC